MRGRDIDGYCALFTDDAIQLFTDDAIQMPAGVKPALTQNRMDVTLVPHDTLLLGHHEASVRVVVTGTHTPHRGASADMNLTALFLLGEQPDQGWKIHQQIWTVKS